MAISLETKKIIKTLDLSGLVAKASRLQYIAVEYAPNGQPFVYVTDAATRSIIVHDVIGNKGYRIVLPSELLSDVKRRDVLYAALIAKGCGNNYLLFTYLSSGHVLAIKTEHLRTGAATGRVVVVGAKPKGMVLLGTDLGSALFFRWEGEGDVYRWDADSPFTPENFVKVYSSPMGMFSTHVFPDLKRLKMRSLDSNFPDFVKGHVGCGAAQQISLLAEFAA